MYWRNLFNIIVRVLFRCVFALYENLMTNSWFIETTAWVLIHLLTPTVAVVLVWLSRIRRNKLFILILLTIFFDPLMSYTSRFLSSSKTAPLNDTYPSFHVEPETYTAVENMIEIGISFHPFATILRITESSLIGIVNNIEETTISGKE